MKHLIFILTLTLTNIVNAQEIKSIPDSKDLSDLIWNIDQGAQELGNFPSNGYFMAIDGETIQDYIHSTDFAENEFDCKLMKKKDVVGIFVEKARFMKDGAMSPEAVASALSHLELLLDYDIEVCFTSEDVVAADSQTLMITNKIDKTRKYEMLIEWQDPFPMPQFPFSLRTVPSKVSKAVEKYEKELGMYSDAGYVKTINKFGYSKELGKDRAVLLQKVRKHFMTAGFLETEDTNIDQMFEFLHEVANEDVSDDAYSKKLIHKLVGTMEDYLANVGRGSGDWEELTFTDSSTGDYETVIVNFEKRTVVQVEWNSGE